MSWAGCRLFLALLLVLGSSPAWGCSIAATGVAFGGYNPFDSTHLDSTGQITVWCESSYSLRIDPGTAGTYTQRQMSGQASHRIHYNLYADYGRALIWGDGTSGTQTVGGSGGEQPTEHVVYGRIPAGQNAHVGGYSDTLTVTIEF